MFFLPLMSPWNPFVMAWTQVVLGLDLSYTAFLLPIIVGFQVSDVGWGYGEVQRLSALACAGLTM